MARMSLIGLALLGLVCSAALVCADGQGNKAPPKFSPRPNNAQVFTNNRIYQDASNYQDVAVANIAGKNSRNTADIDLSSTQTQTATIGRKLMGDGPSAPKVPSTRGNRVFTNNRIYQDASNYQDVAVANIASKNSKNTADIDLSSTQTQTATIGRKLMGDGPSAPKVPSTRGNRAFTNNRIYQDASNYQTVAVANVAGKNSKNTADIDLSSTQTQTATIGRKLMGDGSSAPKVPSTRGNRVFTNNRIYQDAANYQTVAVANVAGKNSRNTADIDLSSTQTQIATIGAPGRLLLDASAPKRAAANNVFTNNRINQNAANWQTVAVANIAGANSRNTANVNLRNTQTQTATIGGNQGTFTNNRINQAASNYQDVSVANIAGANSQNTANVNLANTQTQTATIG